MAGSSTTSTSPLADAPQRGQPLGDQVLVRREGVVGQRLPVGEHGARAGSGAKNGSSSARRCASAGSAVTIGGELRLRALLRLREAREQQRIGRAERARQREALAGGDGGELHEASEAKANRPGECVPRGDASARL